MALYKSSPQQMPRVLESHCRIPTGANMSGPCTPRNLLMHIAKSYNRTHPEHKIDVRMPKAQLYDAINRLLADECGTDYNEACWLHSTNEHITPEIRRRIESYVSPTAPMSWRSVPDTWLSNVDIDQVMNPITNHRALRFQYMGTFPIDFQERDSMGSCVGKGMCDFVARDLRPKKKKDRWGMILNLDTHEMSGSHWVAMYCDMDPASKKYGIYYFDSNGKPPPSHVQRFVRQVKHEINDKRFRFSWSKVPIQRSNTECGMFCIVYLMCMLYSTMGAAAIVKNRDIMNDANMLRYRNTIFHVPTKF